MPHRLRAFSAPFIALVLAVGGVARADAPGPRQVTSVEGITEYQLANGLRVLLFPEPSKPTITVNMTYLVGSRYEGYGETGMAHLLEHMLFKGSTNHPNIPQELTSHGARPNGSTSFDRTNYFETFAASDANLQWALEMEADRMVHSFVAKKDLDTEMTVVRNEYEMGENDPDNILEQRTLSTAFLWHNYGKSTIGARSDIENVPIEHLQAFWRKYYQPDNAVLLVSGRFDPAKTLALVDHIFSTIPRPERVLDATYTREPAQDGERSVTLRRVGDVQSVSALYHVPSGSHPDAGALDILAEVVGSAPSGRLYKALVEPKKAASVAAWFWSLDEPGVLYAAASVRQTASLEDARSALLGTLDDVAKNPPTKEEVERARTTLLKNIELTLANTERVGLALSEWVAKGDWRLFFLYRDRVRQATVEDVARVAATYLKPSNRTVGEFIPTASPDRVTVPEAPPLSTQLAGYKGDPEIARGEAFDASPENIEARTSRVTLPSGLKLALLSKKTRGATVNATISFDFGDEQSLMNLGRVPSFTGALLNKGTAKHTREQLRDEFDRLKARVAFSGVADHVQVSVETVRESLPAVLSLIAEILRTPTFPEVELERERQAWVADLEQEKSEPKEIAGIALAKHLSPYPKGDPRYVQTTDEEIASVNAVKRDDIVSFYKRFYGGSHGEASFVGDFDADSVRRQVGELFGDWKSPGRYVRMPKQYFDRPAVDLSFETPDKENAVFLAGVNLALRDDDPDFPALIMGNYMLGGGFLSSRLAVRIRQKEGISYGVGSSLSASDLDKVGSFGAYAIYAPQNADRLYAAFDEELKRALKEGFTDKELNDARDGWLQGRALSRAQDGGLSGILVRDLFSGRTMKWDEKLERDVRGLTPDRIRTTMARYIHPDRISRVKAGNFAKAGPVAAGK
jgi:zinc protease